MPPHLPRMHTSKRRRARARGVSVLGLIYCTGTVAACVEAPPIETEIGTLPVAMPVGTVQLIW